MTKTPSCAMKSGKPIKKGDLITFKPEWSDPGDETVTFRAIEDEDGGRFKVVAELGLPINPVHVVSTTLTMVA